MERSLIPQPTAPSPQLRALGLIRLAFCGALTLLCWWRIRELGDLRQHLGAFWGWFAAAFGCYLAALGLVQGMGAVSRRQGAWGLVVIIAVAVLSRLVMLGSPPSLSEDVYRSRWDGRVQLAGYDPYAFAPNDPALAFLRDAEFSRINFPQLRSVYPPLTQWACRLGVTLGQGTVVRGPWTVDGGIVWQKAVWVAAELLTMASVLVLLIRRGGSPLWVAAYAWHPLVILEVAGSGHNDALGVACLWMGLACWEWRVWAGCALAWTASFLSKFASLIMAPWWWARRAARGWGLGFVALSLAWWAAQPQAVGAFVESFTAMGAIRSSSNASCYAVLAWLLGSARLALIVAAGLGACWLWGWARRTEDPIRYLAGAVMAVAVLTPALHPWYLVWLVPCFCFVRSRAMMALSGTVVLAYAVWPGFLAGGPWRLPAWALAAEYAPVALWGAWAWGRRVRLVSPIARQLDSSTARQPHLTR